MLATEICLQLFYRGTMSHMVSLALYLCTKKVLQEQFCALLMRCCAGGEQLLLIVAGAVLVVAVVLGTVVVALLIGAVALLIVVDILLMYLYSQLTRRQEFTNHD